LLTSPKLREAINDLKQKYDLVLLDCPPVMPVADPRIIAASADCALLVINVENNNQQTALLAKTQLEQNNINVIGTVVNVPKVGAFGSGYEYYKYEYTYKADGTKSRVPKRGTNGDAKRTAISNRITNGPKS
jgi:Mrp family chromosome partitioning ATPase